MPEDQNNQFGRHLNPEELAKAIAQQLAASEPKNKRKPARRIKEERPTDRGSQVDTPLVSRVISGAAILGLCFGVGIAIAAAIVWATGSLPGSAAEPTVPPTVTFPGQVTTTAGLPPTTEAPATTVVVDTTTTTLPSETSTTTEGTTSTTGTTTPAPTTTTSQATTTTTTTMPTTTTTTTPPSATITCNGGSCTAGSPFPQAVEIELDFSCSNLPPGGACVGQMRAPGSSDWTAMPGIFAPPAGTYDLRVILGQGGPVLAETSFTAE